MDQKHEASNIGDESREEKLGWRDYAWALATDRVTLLCCLFLVTLAISAGLFAAAIAAVVDCALLAVVDRATSAAPEAAVLPATAALTVEQTAVDR